MTITTRQRALSRFGRRLPGYALFAALLVLVLYPLLWLILGSFKTQFEFLNEPSFSLPSSLHWENYTEALFEAGIGRYILNSLAVVLPSLFFTILFGVGAAYAIQILHWKGRQTVLLLFLAGIMIPGQMVVLPLFTAFFTTGLTGTLYPLIIAYTAAGLPLTVFLLSTYFRAIPTAVFEAAMLDGASGLRSFWSVGVPMIRNALFTVGLVQFFLFYNDLLLALTFTTDASLRTVQVGLLAFRGEFGQTSYGPLFAAISVNVIGTLIIYLFLNQRIMKGLTAGSVK